MNGWMAATEGRRSASRSVLTKDRERPDTYVQVVEFPSYEEAMANSALPETTAFAEKLSALCVSGPTFRNLDVVRVDELSHEPDPPGPAPTRGRTRHGTGTGYRTTSHGGSLRRCRFWPNGVPLHSSTMLCGAEGNG